MKKIIIILFSSFFVFLQGCGSGSSGSAENGYLALQFEERNEFDPDAAPGVIDNFKISISGEGLDSQIIKYYAPDTQSVQFDGFPNGSVIQITVEAINQNGFVIRRGYSDPITIHAGAVAQALVEIYNVPIFTNVKPQSYVNVDRFVPKIFAPGEIQFQLSNTVDSVTTSLTDMLSGDLTLSISSDLYVDSIRPIYITGLGAGEQTLRVEDPETLEATNVEVTGYHSSSRKVLTTTSGSYLGVAGRPGADGTNLGSYLQTFTEL